MLYHQAVLGLTPHVETLGVLLGVSIGAHSQIMFDIQKVVRLISNIGKRAGTQVQHNFDFSRGALKRLVFLETALTKKYDLT